MLSPVAITVSLCSGDHLSLTTSRAYGQVRFLTIGLTRPVPYSEPPLYCLAFIQYSQ